MDESLLEKVPQSLLSERTVRAEGVPLDQHPEQGVAVVQVKVGQRRLQQRPLSEDLQSFPSLPRPVESNTQSKSFLEPSGSEVVLQLLIRLDQLIGLLPFVRFDLKILY